MRLAEKLDWKGLRNPYPYFPHFLTVSQHKRSPQIKSSNNCKFCENRGNESHALFKGVENKFG
jgi:hypothetical protein